MSRKTGKIKTESTKYHKAEEKLKKYALDVVKRAIDIKMKNGVKMIGTPSSFSMRGPVGVAGNTKFRTKLVTLPGDDLLDEPMGMKLEVYHGKLLVVFYTLNEKKIKKGRVAEDARTLYDHLVNYRERLPKPSIGADGSKPVSHTTSITHPVATGEHPVATVSVTPAPVKPINVFPYPPEAPKQFKFKTIGLLTQFTIDWGKNKKRVFVKSGKSTAIMVNYNKPDGHEKITFKDRDLVIVTDQQPQYLDSVHK